MNSANQSAIGPIIAGNCIRCMGRVRISENMSLASTVRCPHCHDSFPLSELLDQTLPPLEVVSNNPAPQPGDESAPYIDTLHIKREEQAAKPERPKIKFEIPKALRDGAKRKRRRKRRRSSSSSSADGTSTGSGSSRRSGSDRSRESRRSRSSSSSSSAETTGVATLTPDSSESSSQSSDGQSSSRRPSSSYRGKVRSSVDRDAEAEAKAKSFDFLKTAMGASLALPLAYLIMIWMFKADPVGLAKPTSRMLPFIIPASMHADDSDVEKAATTRARSTNRSDSVYDDEEDLRPFEPERRRSDDPIAIPSIDPDEVFGQEFGL